MYSWLTTVIAALVIYRIVAEVQAGKRKRKDAAGKATIEELRSGLRFLGRPDPGEGTPEWAAPMTMAEMNSLLEKVGDYFRSQQAGADIYVVAGRIKTRDGRFDKGMIALDNLAESCRRADAGQWDRIIRIFFDDLAASIAREGELESKIKEFDQVKDLIHVGLYAREDFEQEVFTDAVFREVLPATMAVLLYLLDNWLYTVKRGHIQAWGRSEDELFRLAFRNVREHHPPIIRDVPAPHDVTIKIVGEKHQFDATYSLLIEHYPELLGTHGSLLGIPIRSTMVVFPINDLRVKDAILTLLVDIIQLHREGPDPVSDKLFWYRDGEYRELPYALYGKEIDFRPPQDFVEMVTLLGGQGNWGVVS